MKKTLCNALFACFFCNLLHAQAGSLDSSFGENGQVTASLRPSSGDAIIKTITKPNGKILTLGFSFVREKSFVIIGRYNADGKRDKNFGNDGFKKISAGSNNKLIDIELLPDNKILVAGTILSPGFNNDILLLKFNADGSPDVQFGENGEVIKDVNREKDDHVSDMAVGADGKIVVVGNTGHESKFFTARFNSDGSVDSTFDQDGVAVTKVGDEGFDNAQSVVITDSGKIVTGGFVVQSHEPFDLEHFAVVRYKQNGKLDPHFGNNGIVVLKELDNTSSAFLQSLKLLPNGKLLAGGYATIHNPDSRSVFMLVQLKQNGTLDDHFGDSGIAITEIYKTKYVDVRLTDIAIQRDKKIIACGNVLSDSILVLARYEKDGTLDNGFGKHGVVKNPVNGYWSNCTSVEIQPDGKILASGYGYKSLTNDSDFLMVRFKGDEALASNEAVNNAIVQSENKKVKIYPNPVSDQLHITGLDPDTNAAIVITDITGKIIKKLDAGNINSITINTKSFAPGTYYLIIQKENKRTSYKFIKQ